MSLTAQELIDRRFLQVSRKYRTLARPGAHKRNAGDAARYRFWLRGNPPATVVEVDLVVFEQYRALGGGPWPWWIPLGANVRTWACELCGRKWLVGADGLEQHMKAKHP